MDRRDFLTGMVAVSGTTALGPLAKLAPGGLAYVRHYETNVGAPAGTSCFFGKHTQWAYCNKDGKLYAYGGDGSWRLPMTNFSPNAARQSLNSVLSYDFANGGRFEQLSNQFGNPADGTMPYFHDGCTWVYNSQEDAFYAIPGYTPPYTETKDPNRLARADLGKVHKFDRVTRKWSTGPIAAGNWVGEHWGGCYDSKRNRIWIQAAMGNEYGGLKWFDCASQAWGKVGLKKTPNLVRFPNIGYEVITSPWCQRYNPVTDEIIVFDGYRGYVIGIPLAEPSPTPRIIANVPAYRNDVAGEPIGTIETGACISVRRQKMLISYSMQNQYVIGGVGGVWTIDLATGAREHVNYPSPPGVDSQWTQAEYDDTNDCLILAAYVVDSLVWGRRFLMYKFIGQRTGPV